jgi:hypothetical protein
MLINISTVGGQVMPVYQGLIHSKPDKVYLLHSEDSLEQANILMEIYPCDFQLIQIDAFDFEEIMGVSEDIESEHPDDTFFVNSTGGTKIMSIAVVSVFAQEDRAMIAYIDQNENVIDLNKREIYEIDKSLITIAICFALSGNKLKSFDKLNEIPASDFKIVEQIKKKPLPFDIYDLGQLANMPHKPLKGEHKNGSNFTIDKETGYLTVNIFNKLNPKYDIYKFESKNARSLVLNTGWFELEVATILKPWKYATEIILNAIVNYEKGQAKNEIDIIVNLGNKLLFVECKLQMNEIKDVDKFRNVVKNYGGLGAKGIIILDQKPNDRVIEKCKDSNLMLFSLESVRNNAMGLTIEKALFSMLDAWIHQSNLI